jgi:glycosyltransferase involved in cell wall biosynthesis
MRILQLVAYPRLTRGTAIQAYLLGRSLRDRGHDVLLALTDDGRTGDEPSGLPVTRIPADGPRAAWRVRHLLRRGDFDIVHVHYRDAALRMALVAAAGGRPPPLVASWGNCYPIDGRRWARLGMAEADGTRSFSAWTGFALRSRRVSGITAVSRAARDVLVDTAGVPPDKIHVIYEGCDPEAFHPGRDRMRFRRELGLDPDTPLVGMLAAYYWVKDFPTFIAAARIVARHRPEARFVIVGDRAEEARGEWEGTELGSRMTALAARADVPDVLAALDVVVNTSRYDGLCGVLREALAMAKPVVSTDVGGNREIVIPGETGVLAPPARPEAIAAAILELLSRPRYARQMGARGREHVVRRHTLAGRCDRIERLYRALLRGDTPNRPHARPKARAR